MLIKIIQAISYTCDYCMNHGLTLNKQEVPVEDLITFYDKLFSRELNKDNFLDINFTITGGEPFHPQVIGKTTKLLEYLYSLNFIHSVRINTNGYYPLPDICKNEKTLIQFSIDGDKEYCDTISHKPGLYDKMIENLEYCKQNNIEFQTRTVVSKDNINRINNVIDLANKYEHLAYIQAPRPVGGASNEEIIEMLELTRELEEKYMWMAPGSRVAPQYERCDFFNNRNLRDGIAILVNPFGEIGGCAFLATKYMSNFNIYNFFDITLGQYKIISHKFVKDATCCFPDGLSTFKNSLSFEQLEKVRKMGYLQ